MTVIAGVDDSPFAGEVVAKAIEEAKWRDDDLHVVHVMHIPLVYTEVAIDWAEVAEAQRSSVWARLDPILAEAGIRFERVNLDGYPPDMLVEYANEQDASLLVVGTRGRGDFASLILGSTSHRAIHLADCDILVVKAKSEDES